MDLDRMLSMLESKDTTQAFEALKEMEKISDTSDAFYPYTEKFIEMINSSKYVIRVRGFRMFCKQAKWDTENIINKNIEAALSILNDDKPTAVRQALAALQEIIPYKKELGEIIEKKVSAIDYLKFKDTMHSLIANDIQKVLEAIG